MAPVIDRIVLHVGLPKTGSTAIQHSLLASAEDLATQGVAIPVTSAIIHRAMSGATFVDHANLLTLNPDEILLPGLTRIYATRPLTPDGKQLLDEMDRLISSEKYHTLVLSAELLALCSEPTIARISQELHARAPKVDVCMYVRPPDHLYRSHIAQAVRDGDRWRSPSAFRSGMRKAETTMSRHFGDGHVTVLAYKDNEPGWDVSRDFGRRLLDYDLTGSRMNRSLSLQGLYTVHSYRSTVNFENRHLRDRFELLVSWLSERDHLYAHRISPELAPSVKEQVFKSNRGDVSWLNQLGLFGTENTASSRGPAVRRMTGLNGLFCEVPSREALKAYSDWIMDGLLEACVVLNVMLHDSAGSP